MNNGHLLYRKVKHSDGPVRITAEPGQYHRNGDSCENDKYDFQETQKKMEVRHEAILLR